MAGLQQAVFAHFIQRKGDAGRAGIGVTVEVAVKLFGRHAQTADACVHRPEWEGAFDLVLVDAPCSGLGVIRKKPDIRYKDPEPLAALPSVQRRILENVSSYVRPGGTLLYSTCTLLRRENEDVVSAFLEAHPQFGPEPFQLPGVPGTEGSSWMLTLWPHIQGTDGFFISRMKKREEAL